MSDESGYVRAEVQEWARSDVEMAFTSVWRRRPDGGWRVVSNNAHVVRT